MNASPSTTSFRAVTAPRAPRRDQRVVDGLLAEGRIGGDQHRRVIELAASRKGRVEEAILELGILHEGELLRYLSGLYKTRFVSADKLSKAAIGAQVLDLCSTATAERHGVIPVLFDDRTGTLSVVTADPDDEQALRELKAASPAVQTIEALVARPAAVRAAIALHYRGDKAAFRALLPARDAGEAEGRVAPGSSFATQPTRPAEPGPDEGRRTSPAPISARRRAAPVTPPSPVRHRPSAIPPVPRVPPPPAIPRGMTDVDASDAPSTSAHFLKTVSSLVAFFERSRGDLSGHSASVARLVETLCERMGTGREHAAAIVVAAHLHDLGKGDGPHLTALDVAKDEALQHAAGRCARAPMQILASIDLAPDTEAAIAAMYERWDGKGLPFGRGGKDIPLGARILAVADTFVDLTECPQNRYHRALRPFEACAVLLKYAGTVFDPVVVDVLRKGITGAEERADKSAELPAVLRG